MAVIVTFYCFMECLQNCDAICLLFRWRMSVCVFAPGNNGLFLPLSVNILAHWCSLVVCRVLKGFAASASADCLMILIHRPAPARVCTPSTFITLLLLACSFRFISSCCVLRGVRLGQLSLAQLSLAQLSLAQLRLGQVRLGQARLGQARRLCYAFNIYV